jgi:hypothetical protein
MYSDFSSIITTLQTNGVEFIELFFKSNFHTENLKDRNEISQETDPSEEDKKLIADKWIIDFSDGKNHLGTFITTTYEKVDVMDSEDDMSVVYVIEPTELEEIIKTKTNIVIELKMTAGLYKGRATIYEAGTGDTLEF